MDDREEIQAAVVRLQQGDIGGLEILMLRYQVRAVRTATLITRDRALAEDLVQSAFLRVYERIDQFDATRPFGPWFLRSVTNDAVKASARQQRYIPLVNLAENPGTAANDPADPQPGPAELVERAETYQALWAALGCLTPTQRAAVVQRYYLGFSQTKMAEALAVPPSTVRWRLHAARDRLRQLLRPPPLPDSTPRSPLRGPQRRKTTMSLQSAEGSRPQPQRCPHREGEK